MGFLDKVKGVFKKQDKSDMYRKIYAAKTLKEVIQEMDDPAWESFELEKKCAIQTAYIEKLFTSPAEEGGFGLEGYNGLYDALGIAYTEFGLDDTPYQYGFGEDKKIRNYKLEYLKNCVKRGCIGPLGALRIAFDKIFPRDEDALFTKAQLRNPDFPIYHPWVLEGEGLDQYALKDFISTKINVVSIITDPNQLEYYGAFKQVNGKPTDEYVTIEDFVGIKNLKALKRFLDQIQTRGFDEDDDDDDDE